MAKIDPSRARTVQGGRRPDDPAHFNWIRRPIGDVAGLSQFGVNLLELPPGAWSSSRHWHSHEDEFVHVLEGEVVLVTGQGETVLRAGECAGFKAGIPDGHHLQNRSGSIARVLEVGSRRPEADVTTYPDLGRRKTPAGDEPIR